MFGLTQGESQEGDVSVKVGDMNFHVEEEFAGVINFFEIDYYKGWLQKGFVVNANGVRGTC